ncbi:unnamed protein product, partial [Rotaria magnacalcarata]
MSVWIKQKLTPTPTPSAMISAYFDPYKLSRTENETSEPPGRVK